MTPEDKPLSALVAQGWEIVGFAASPDKSSGTVADSVLLRRMKAHKILKIRRRLFRPGYSVTVLDI